MRFLIILITLTYLNADLFNFVKLFKAKSLYENGDFNTSAKILKSLNYDTPSYNYNLANTLYKTQKYNKALIYYKRAFGNSVNEAYRLYNIGNCYYKLKDYDNAITAYQLSLKIKEDNDTKVNLALAKRAKYKKPEKKKDSQKKKKEKKKRKEKQKKNSKKKSKKLTKKDLKKLQKMLKKKKLKKKMKKLIKQSFKNKKVPVLMYKYKDGTDKIESSNPW